MVKVIGFPASQQRQYRASTESFTDESPRKVFLPFKKPLKFSFISFSYETTPNFANTFCRVESKEALKGFSSLLKT